MPRAVKVHHLPVALGNASLQQISGQIIACLFLHNQGTQNVRRRRRRRRDKDLNIGELSQVRVQRGQRFIHDVLVVVQPQRVCVLQDAHTHTHRMRRILSLKTLIMHND